MRRRSHYSDLLKWAVAEKIAKGLKVKVAVLDYGIPKRTVLDWKNESRYGRLEDV